MSRFRDKDIPSNCLLKLRVLQSEDEEYLISDCNDNEVERALFINDMLK